jgi:quinol monooxygenase YgiN
VFTERRRTVAQRSVEILIGRVITDETFRSAFRTNAISTLRGFVESGYELTSVEVAALCATPTDVWDQAAVRIDERLQKVSYAATVSSLGCGPKGEPMATFEVSAHMTVRPGQLEGFKKQAAECIRITREKDTHTLRYDWFLSRDGSECEVREAYTGPEGLIEHNRNIVDARTKLFDEYADNHFMTVYGDPTPQLLDLVKAHHMEHQFKWFSFVKGLDSSMR